MDRQSKLRRFVFSTLCLLIFIQILVFTTVISVTTVNAVASDTTDGALKMTGVGIPLDVKSPAAVKAAEFAVSELAKLSDSDIYTTISLGSILSASYQNGIFHYNTLLELELASDFFKSGKPYEKYSFVVMTHKDDETSSIAIDEFPVMDEDAIERYYIQKIERKRKAREEAFRRLEIEAYLMNEHQAAHSRYPPERAPATDLASLSTEQLLVELDKRTARISGGGDGSSADDGVLDRLSGHFLEEERVLRRMSSPELHEISVGGVGAGGASEFQAYRAQQLLNERMKSL